MVEGTVTGGKLYCRKMPQAGYDYWGRFDDGAKIPIYTCSTAGWYETRWPATGSNVGYVMKEFVNTSGSSGGGTYTGATGSGPNATISASDIRNGKGVWKVDTKTTHPQIKNMQSKLNSCASAWGTDVPQCGTPDGIFGSNTQSCLKWFQTKKFVGTNQNYGAITADGVVGVNTMDKLDYILGTIG